MQRNKQRPDLKLPFSCAPLALDPGAAGGINAPKWRDIAREIIKGVKRAAGGGAVQRGRMERMGLETL